MPTQVTGTLIDSLGQKWANAPIQFVFFPTPNTPGPFTANGAEFDKMPPVILTDSNGTFSTTLTSNYEINPSGSQWQMIIGPNSSYPAIVLTISLTGNLFNVSPLFAASGAVMAVQSLYIPRAYADSEVLIPPNSGQLYYDVINKQFKYWESGNWNVLAAPAGTMVYPPPGIAVSTGTGWAASIDPANIAFTNITNTFALNQIFNGSIDVGSGAISIGRRGQVSGSNANINADTGNLFLNSPASGGIYFNWDQGTTGTHFGNGAGGQVGYVDQAGNAGFSGDVAAGGTLRSNTLIVNGNADIGSNLHVSTLQVNGPVPAGYILQSDGSYFRPVPFPAASHGSLVALTTDYGTGGKSFNSIYNNTGTSIKIVSGAARCNEGGHVGSVQCLIGLNGANPTLQVFGMTTGAEVNNGVIGFNFTVPANATYQVLANTLTNGQGNGVVGISSWIEIDISII